MSWITLEYGQLIMGGGNRDRRNVRSVPCWWWHCLDFDYHPQLPEQTMKGGIPTLEPMLLWAGVTIITLAIFMSAKAYSNLAQEKRKPSIKGVLLAVTGRVFIAFFDPLVSIRSTHHLYPKAKERLPRIPGGSFSLLAYSSALSSLTHSL